MTRRFISFPIADLQQTKLQMLNWGNQFNICSFLDNHSYHLPHNSVECILGAGTLATLQANAGNALNSLSSFQQTHSDWLFGHLGYDLKNEIEDLRSSNSDGIKFADLFFFVPRYVLKLGSDSILIGSTQDDHQHVYDDIIQQISNTDQPSSAFPEIQMRFARDEYTAVVQQLRDHILRGDCYEINFCQEFYASDVKVDPLSLYLALSNESPNPFSAFYKVEDKFLVCMSPERYLMKEGKTILSQPMKGTSKRYRDNPELDQQYLKSLKQSEKERAENIMVVDLVRNDLSKICEHGTVHVDELCEVYSFPQVHQMISTVSGTIRNDVELKNAIRATFPMGSMTGAPKKKVMELIERYEKSARGLFSGSIGYVTPDNDFDFNVVIRSVLYNATTRYLSFHTGSAITFNSEPEKEYEECLLKGAAIKKALAETNTFH